MDIKIRNIAPQYTANHECRVGWINRKSEVSYRLFIDCPRIGILVDLRVISLLEPMNNFLGFSFLDSLFTTNFSITLFYCNHTSSLPTYC